MYVCESDWFTQYGPVKHWVHCKSISHPPHQISLCPLLRYTYVNVYCFPGLATVIIFNNLITVCRKLRKITKNKKVLQVFDILWPRFRGWTISVSYRHCLLPKDGHFTFRWKNMDFALWSVMPINQSTVVKSAKLVPEVSDVAQSSAAIVFSV